MIVLVQYSERIENADQNLFWKLRLYLSDKRIEVYLTSSSSKNIGDWVSVLANEYAIDFDPKSLEFSEAQKILAALGYNIFLISKLLKNITLRDIFSVLVINRLWCRKF